MFPSTLVLFILLSHGVYASEPECGMYYDKFNRLDMMSRNYIVGETWPKNTVPYVFDGAMSYRRQQMIKEGIKKLEEVSCLTYVPRTSEKNYIHIQDTDSGCYANLGFSRYRKRHLINIGKGCERIGTICHELLHALGLGHEHTRPDRDDYVKIMWSRISRKEINNFFRNADANETPLPPRCRSYSSQPSFDSCYSGYRAETFGFGYDFGSVMHYPKQAFSTSRQETIVPKVHTNEWIGQRRKLSSGDIKKLNTKYKCSGFTRPSTIPTIPTTTTKPPFKISCVDKDLNCWDLRGQCTTSMEFLIKCRESCNACYGCEDKITNCERYLKYCDASDVDKKYMSSIIQKNCAKSCKLCVKK